MNKLLLLLGYDALTGERLDCVYGGTANLNFSHATKFPLYLSFPVHFLSFPVQKQTNKKEKKGSQAADQEPSLTWESNFKPQSWKELKKAAH